MFGLFSSREFNKIDDSFTPVMRLADIRRPMWCLIRVKCPVCGKHARLLLPEDDAAVEMCRECYDKLIRTININAYFGQYPYKFLYRLSVPVVRKIITEDLAAAESTLREEDVLKAALIQNYVARKRQGKAPPPGEEDEPLKREPEGIDFNSRKITHWLIALTGIAAWWAIAILIVGLLVQAVF